MRPDIESLERFRRQPRQRMLHNRQPSAARAQIEHLLKSYLEKTGFPFDEFNRLRTEDRAEQRKLLDSEATAMAPAANVQEAEFRETLKRQREALSRLAPTTIITLDQPIAIELFNNTHLVVFSSHLEPFNSFAEIHIEKNSGFDFPTVSFTFEWINSSPNTAIIDVGTLLRLHGSYDVKSESGFFSSPHRNSLSIDASLIATRGTGWGIDPSGNSLDGTSLPLIGNTLQSVVDFALEGGILFDEDQPGSFTALPVGLGVDDIFIPPGASVLFSPLFEIRYSLDNNADENDLVKIDFSNVGCPFFNIEVTEVP